MFQDNALFPHRNVFGNVAFGLKQLQMKPEAIDKQVSAILNIVGMRDLADRDVLSLSGGEQQRVALARTIAPNPRLLMLDEPLGSLDRNLREQLLHELRHILTDLEQTVIYVTHDQDEAFAIADRVVIMNTGKLIQIGSPRDIYAHPASTFIARFLGLTNILKTSVVSVDTNKGVKISENSLIPISQPPPKHIKHPRILVRPRGAQLSEYGTLSGILTNVSFRGALVDLKIIVSNGLQLRFEVPTPSIIPKVGTKINLKLPEDAAIWIEDDSL
jgi:ABC-type Fe3+/spermidine/putrescine transport system ATPase subunit